MDGARGFDGPMFVVVGIKKGKRSFFPYGVANFLELLDQGFRMVWRPYALRIFFQIMHQVILEIKKIVGPADLFFGDARKPGGQLLGGHTWRPAIAMFS